MSICNFVIFVHISSGWVIVYTLSSFLAYNILDPKCNHFSGVQSGEYPELNQLMKDKYDEELELTKSLVQQDFDAQMKEEKVSFSILCSTILKTERSRLLKQCLRKTKII